MQLHNVEMRYLFRNEMSFDTFLTRNLLLLLKLQDLRHFYIIAVGVIFVTAMVIQIPRLNVSSQFKIIIFVGWALFGIFPTMHWAIEMGGFHNAMVSVSSLKLVGLNVFFKLTFYVVVINSKSHWNVYA